MTTQSINPSIPQSISHSTPCIMESTTSELKQLMLRYMSRFDDYIQIAYDEEKPDLGEYFSNEYNKLDHHYRSISDTQTVSAIQRNEIRMIVKYTERLACTELEITETTETI